MELLRPPAPGSPAPGTTWREREKAFRRPALSCPYPTSLTCPRVCCPLSPPSQPLPCLATPCLAASPRRLASPPLLAPRLHSTRPARPRMQLRPTTFGCLPNAGQLSPLLLEDAFQGGCTSSITWIGRRSRFCRDVRPPWTCVYGGAAPFTTGSGVAPRGITERHSYGLLILWCMIW